MARKTAPVPVQVIPPYQPYSAAYFQARLIDFDTGSAQLEEQHRAWLAAKIAYAKRQSTYSMWLVGYASKLGSKPGDDSKNVALSLARMNTVVNFAKFLDRTVVSLVHGFEAAGSTSGNYNASDNDNAPEQRAIEVHIFLQDPPPPPEDLKPIYIPKPPLVPGKTKNWSIAAPGGGQGTIVPPLMIAFNVFVIKNRDTGEMRGYLASQLGIGLSASIKGLSTAKNAIQNIVTGGNYSNMDFTDLTATEPLNWDELEKCLVTCTGVGGGTPSVLGGYLGYQIVHTRFDAPAVQIYSSADTPITHPVNSILSWESHGKSYQIGVGAGVLTGPLKRVD